MAVPNSTPPPATSPVSIRVKSEPQSPPRDLSGCHHQQNSNGSAGSNGSGGGGGGGGGSSSSVSAANALSLANMNASAVIAGGGGSGGGPSASEQAANLSVLSHPQQHMVMPGSRPSSTGGHLTPTQGGKNVNIYICCNIQTLVFLLCMQNLASLVLDILFNTPF